jgi:hypothetical protein
MNDSGDVTLESVFLRRGDCSKETELMTGITNPQGMGGRDE